MVGIYAITNMINGCRYIGQSIHIDIRFREHLYHLRRNDHFNRHLQSSFNLYGESNFKFEVIELCNREDLNDRETYWKRYFDPDTYNLGNTGNVDTVSEETKRKTSSTLKQKYAKLTIEDRKKKFSVVPNPNLGKKRPKAVRDKISNSLKGRSHPHSEAHIQSLRDSSTCKRKIAQYTKSGELIKIWPCINDAARDLCGSQANISSCCSGHQKTSYGYVWKYIDT